MRLTRHFLATLVIIGVLPGCATLSKQQCMMGNWQTIGYNDGVAGHYADRLASHTKACAKAGVVPDYQAWELGRQQGLKQYCTSANAYVIGQRGRQLNGVCPAAILPRLQQFNAQGREYYSLSNQLTQEKKQLTAYLEEYDKLRNGERLHYKTEKEARARLVELPSKIVAVKRRIANAQARLQQLTL